MTNTARTVLVAALVDLAAILAFAAVGRREHGGVSGLADVAETAAPFAIGYVVAAAVLRLDRAPLSPPLGAVVAALTVTLGMVLRQLVFDRGTAAAFVVVAAVTIVGVMAGWRLVVRAARGRRSSPGPSRPGS